MTRRELLRQQELERQQQQEAQAGILRCKKCGNPLSYKKMDVGRTGLCQECFNVEIGYARRRPSSSPGERKRERDRIYYLVFKAKGSAKDYKCNDCRKRAAQWSHIHDTDSYDPNNYVPRCYNCHVRYYGRGRWEPQRPKPAARKQREEIFYETG